MKTLIFNGSPRENGDTKALLECFTGKLEGEVMVIDCYKADIKPCVDCRYCKVHRGCAFEDGMQEVYSYLEECDNVVVASPIYFGTLTGELLNVASRLQTYFSARFFRRTEYIRKAKKGGIILVGGGSGGVQTALATAKDLLLVMNCKDDSVFEPVVSLVTDKLPAIDDNAAVDGVLMLADYFNYS